MEHNQVSVAEICSRLYGPNHYLLEDTDVVIECEGQQFLCHRAILAARSVYFRCMFNNGWRESVTGSVVFDGDHMKMATLLEVLKYIYASTMTVTSSNFMDLIYASDYLGVYGLEAHLAQVMLQDRPEPIVDFLEVLSFAHFFSNQWLLNALASCNMIECLKEFFETNEFLPIPADLLAIIVSKLWRSPPIMNEILLRAIYRWRAYALNEREQHALELYKFLEPASELSLNMRLHLMTFVAAPQNPCLYVYKEAAARKMNIARYGPRDPNTGDRAHTFFQYRKRANFAFHRSFNRNPKIRASRFVSVENVGVFGMTNLTKKRYSYYPVFNQFASANIWECGLYLASPPINLMLMCSFDLCNLSNRGLYLLSMSYSPWRHCNPSYDSSKQEFSGDEIQRGIYFYNIGLDRWYPVPAMVSDPFGDSCMTVWNDRMVCLIGSRCNGRSVQAYDDRERCWYNMPHTLHTHVCPQSCVLDGKIYVSSVNYCERYDPVAARWEDIGVFQRDNHEIRRLMSYDNQLWQFKTFGFNRFIEVYDPPTAAWSTIPSLINCGETEEVLDAVIW